MIHKIPSPTLALGLELPVYRCDDCGRRTEVAKVDPEVVHCMHCGGRAYRVRGEVIQDPAVKQEPSFRVVWRGRLCSPAWHIRGAAEVYLAALEAGTRRPEYAR